MKLTIEELNNDQNLKHSLKAYCKVKYLRFFDLNDEYLIIKFNEIVENKVFENYFTPNRKHWYLVKYIYKNLGK